MKQSDGDIIAESISRMLGSHGEEIKLGLSTAGHVRQIDGKYHASARVADDAGQKEIDKHIGVYDTYEEAAEKVIRIRNHNLFALPNSATSNDK